jgi:hypothetical protein
MKRTFVFGNSEVRRTIDVDAIRKHGKTYGCNAIYRDHTLDVLIASDLNMQHEVYSSGYARENTCYFPAFSRLPAEHYEMVLSTMQTGGETIEAENERGDKKEFAIQGVMNESIKARDTALRVKYPGISQAEIDDMAGISGIWILWLDEKDCIINMEIKYEALEPWSSGTQAIHIACSEEEPDELYIIGFGFGYYNGVMDNVYKGTQNYRSTAIDDRTHRNEMWYEEHQTNFETFPKVDFYIVSDDPAIPIAYRDYGNVNLLKTKDFQDRFQG